MIFGLTKEQRNRAEQEDILRKILGVKKFALFPIKLESGLWAWLETVWLYYDGGKREDGTLFLWCSSVEDGHPIVKAYKTPSATYVDFTERRGDHWLPAQRS